jgi:hypothetical protein
MTFEARVKAATHEISTRAGVRGIAVATSISRQFYHLTYPVCIPVHPGTSDESRTLMASTRMLKIDFKTLTL